MSERLTYAIGDIHGRLDLLVAAAERIAAHLNGRQGRIITLGDYVDRGPESRGVVEFLMRAQADPEASVICLKGNHEAMMVNAYREGLLSMDFSHWAGNGGWQTLASYGGNLSNIPPEHIAWMDGLPLMAADDHRLFVHAGVMPGMAADQNDDEVCLWIRERFLRADVSELPAHIVHGHTPQWKGKPDESKPELLPHRTNLDTAAYFTGVLTIGVFDHDKPGGPVEVLRVEIPEHESNAA